MLSITSRPKAVQYVAGLFLTMFRVGTVIYSPRCYCTGVVTERANQENELAKLQCKASLVDDYLPYRRELADALAFFVVQATPFLVPRVALGGGVDRDFGTNTQ